MAKYNVSKREAKELGIKRVRIGGGGGGGGSKARGGLSKREYARKYPGQPIPSSSKSKTKTKTRASIPSIPKIDTTQRDALRTQYQKAIGPTPEETAASTQLENIITSRELGIAKAEREPIPQAFVTGQTKALEKSAALKSMPIQTKLANLQARRQTTADVLKAQLGFETTDIERQDKLAKEARATALAREELEFQRGESAADRAYKLKVFDESKRQFDVSEARLGKTGSVGTWSTVSIGGKLYKIHSKTGEIKETGVAEQGNIDRIAEQLRNMGWSEDEIKAYLLTQ